MLPELHNYSHLKVHSVLYSKQHYTEPQKKSHGGQDDSIQGLPFLFTVAFLSSPCQPAQSASCEQMLSLPILKKKMDGWMDGCKYTGGQSGTAKV
jgi:hypothetical protein